MTTRRLLTLAPFLLIAGFIWLLPYITPPVTDTTTTIEVGNHTLNVQIAATPADHQQGLMHRKDWGNIEGMLFVFQEEQTRHFWMKNTLLPLDIIFFDASGHMVHIAYNTVPMSEALISSQQPAQYALELPTGDANRLGFNETTKLNLSSFAEAL